MERIELSTTEPSQGRQEDTVPIPVPLVAPVVPLGGRHRRFDPGSWHPRTLALATGRLKVIAAGLGLVLAGGVFVVAPVLTAAHRPLSAEPVTVPAPPPSSDVVPSPVPMDTAPPEVTTAKLAPIRHAPKPVPVHRPAPRPKPPAPSSTTPPPAVTSAVVVPTPQTAPPAVPASPAAPPPTQLKVPDWATQAPDNGWTPHSWRRGDSYGDEHQQWGNSGRARGDHWDRHRDTDSQEGSDADNGPPLISIGGAP